MVMWRRVRWIPLALAGCKPAAEVASCSGSTTEQFATEVATHTFLDGCGDITLGGYEVVGDGEFELSLFTDSHQLLPRVTARSDGSVFRALRMDGEIELEGDGPTTLWRLPFASGGAAGPSALGTVALDDDGWPILGEDDGADARPGTSWWAGQVSRADGGAALVGALSAGVVRISLAFDEDGRAWFAWGGRGEAVPLDDGDSLYLDPLFLSVDDEPAQGWASWAAAVATDLTGPTSPAAVGASLDDADAASLASLVGELPEGAWARLGPGWSADEDPWVAGEGWPTGLALDSARPVAVTVDAFAPPPGALVWTDHPDWAVSGVTVDGGPVLDATNPEVVAWLAERASSVSADGVGALELRRAAAGAVEQGGPLPGVAAYRLALQRIRDALGPGVQLWVTGAPVLPSVGLVDGFGVGATTQERGALGFAAGRWWWPLPEPAEGEEALAAALAAGGAVFGQGALDPRVLPYAGRRLTVRFGPDGEQVVVAEDWTALVGPPVGEAAVYAPAGTDPFGGLVRPDGPRTLGPGDVEVRITE